MSNKKTEKHTDEELIILFNKSKTRQGCLEWEELSTDEKIRVFNMIERRYKKNGL